VCDYFIRRLVLSSFELYVTCNMCVLVCNMYILTFPVSCLYTYFYHFVVVLVFCVILIFCTCFVVIAVSLFCVFLFVSVLA
jgi:hypothetical protein